MDGSGPSRTAMGAAMHRAAHQLREGGSIFKDELALPIIGAEGRAALADWSEPAHRRPMRLFIAARHRFTEDKLADAVMRGVRQVVVVGAGLDTTAARGRHAEQGVRYFEVDHPATQAFKRERLAELGLAPAALTFAPVDFERQSLGEGLDEAGFDAARPAFFIWLGVVPYLTEAAIMATLGFIAGGVPGAEVTFDYANPIEQLDPEVRAYHERGAERVARIGEPWISFFDTADLAGRLRGLGATEIDDLGSLEMHTRIFRTAPSGRGGGGGHILWAKWPG
jgi:methyltransferase (TIGR00027 family)